MKLTQKQYDERQAALLTLSQDIGPGDSGHIDAHKALVDYIQLQPLIKAAEIYKGEADAWHYTSAHGAGNMTDSDIDEMLNSPDEPGVLIVYGDSNFGGDLFPTSAASCPVGSWFITHARGLHALYQIGEATRAVEPLVGKISTLESDSTTLNTTVSQLGEDVTALSTANSTLEGKVSTLESDNVSLNTTVSGLETDLGSLSSANDTLNSTVSTLEGNVATLTSDKEALEGQVSTLESTIADLTSRLEVANGLQDTTSESRIYRDDNGQTRTRLYLVAASQWVDADHLIDQMAILEQRTNILAGIDLAEELGTLIARVEALENPTNPE